MRAIVAPTGDEAVGRRGSARGTNPDAQRTVWLLSRQVAVALLVTVTGCRAVAAVHKGYLSACPGAGPEARNDFGLHVAPFNLIDYLASIRSFGDRLEIRELAQIRHDHGEYPIASVARLRPGAAGRLLVIAGIHGNEVAGVLAIPRFLERLAAAPPEYEAWEVFVVPAANPIGLAHRSRYNGAGCDINRDFKSFRTLEARLLRELIHSIEPDIIASLHEGPQVGFMVIVTAAGSPSLGRAVADAVGQAGVPLARRDFVGFRRRVPGLWYEGPLVTLFKKVVGVDSLGAYALKRGVGTYTTESDWSSPDIESRIRSHVIALDALMTTNVNGP
jgi:hypothetical protein